MSDFFILLALMTLASISPILTLLHLWQLKEWRWDRLRDHLKTEGILASLTSKIRIIIGVLWLGGMLTIIVLRDSVVFLEHSEIFTVWILLLGISLSTVSLVQWMQNKQPMPVWTRKALLMFLCSVLGTFSLGLYSIMLFSGESAGGFTGITIIIIICTPFALPYIAPLFVLLAWTLLKPIDLLLKNRILSHAKALRSSHPNLTVIGITGSVGKTTTKELLRHILESKGATSTPLHVNTELGVAAWLIQTLKHEPPDSKKILIIEMGAYRGGEIALLTQIAQPTIGVLTFVGRQHSALFGGETNIAKAKGELLAGLPKDGHAFVNADSPLLDILKLSIVSDATFVGTDHPATVRALDIEETGKGISFQYDGRTIAMPLAGTHNVTNILLAISVAKMVGMPIQEITQKLATFSAFERTFQRREVRGVVILDNTYNASIESFLAVIDWAERHKASKKILLFDGIIELGDDEERLHHMVAEKAAKVFDLAYSVHPKFLRYFTPYFKERITTLAAHPPELFAGNLLVCMGRMSPKMIERFVHDVR